MDILDYIKKQNMEVKVKTEAKQKEDLENATKITYKNVDFYVLNNTLIKVSNVNNEKNIEVPEGVKNIGYEACADLKNIENFIMPNSVTEVGNYAFINSEINNLQLSKNLIILGERAFKDFKTKNLVLPNTLINIKSFAFQNATIENLKLPETLRTITSNMLSYINLKNLEMPNNVFRVISFGVYNANIENVKFSKNLKFIGENAFDGCKFKNLNINCDITEVGEEAFANCPIEMLEYDAQMGIVAPNAFNGCPIKKLKVPINYIMLENRTIFNNAEEITITKAADLDYYSKDNLREFSEKTKNALIHYPLKNGVEKQVFLSMLSARLNNPKKSYLVKTEDEYVFCNEQQLKDNFQNENYKITELSNNNEFGKNIFLFNICLKYPDLKEYLLKDCKNETNTYLDAVMFKVLNKQDFADFVKNKETKFFKHINFSDYSFLVKEDDFKFNEKFETFVKIYYSLGGFLPKEKGNYAQKVGEFVKNKIDKVLDINAFCEIFEGANPLFKTNVLKKECKFNADRTNFLMQREPGFREDNLTRILNYYYSYNNNFQSSYILNFIYENYENLKSLNKSNKGNQRLLKPTLDYFIMKYESPLDALIEKVHNDESLQGYLQTINSDERVNKVVEVINKYYPLDYKILKDALRIMARKNDLNIPDNLIEHSGEKALFNISNLQNSISENQAQTLKKIGGAIKKNYTFEMLSKNSEDNFVLGKYCDCCAHLNAAGAGIAVASIIDKDVQNAVIRDKNGNIIAKSTLYINRDKGYGVFNNVEVAEDYNTRNNRGHIYDAYIEGVLNFVNEYNSCNKDAPLKQINVGMGRNDLAAQIQASHSQATEILPAIQYGIYAVGDMGYYNSDSNTHQYVLYKKDNKKDTL